MRRFACAVLAATAAGVILGASVTGTWASLNAQTRNPDSSFATTSLSAPTGLTATASGRDVQLAWNAGENGSGYEVLGFANGTSSTCPATGYSSIALTTSLTYVDTGRYAPQGTWFCHQVRTSYASWTSTTNTSVATQIGVVITSITMANGANAGVLDAGDRFIVTFNQPIDTSSAASGTNSLCTTSASSPGASILLGSTASSGSCGTSEALNLGRLSGGGSSRNNRYAAVYTWSNGNRTLTITVGARTVGPGNPTITGTWTLSPTTNPARLLSATGGFHVCDTNAGGGNCLPTVSGSL